MNTTEQRSLNDCKRRVIESRNTFLAIVCSAALSVILTFAAVFDPTHNYAAASLLCLMSVLIVVAARKVFVDYRRHLSDYNELADSLRNKYGEFD